MRDRITVRLDEEMKGILTKYENKNHSGTSGGVSEHLRRCVKFYEYNTKSDIRTKIVRSLMWIQDFLTDIEENLILLSPDSELYMKDMKTAEGLLQGLLKSVKLVF